MNSSCARSLHPSPDLETGAYTQHYYDSRGVVRPYAISGAWEKDANGGGWEHDFTLISRRVG